MIYFKRFSNRCLLESGYCPLSIHYAEVLMSSKIVEQVEKLIIPYAESLELDVVEVEYAKKFNGMNLTVFIHKTGGVTIDDCENLHKLIDKPLDDLNPTNDKPYILNVSSLGIDRPLKTQKDFKRSLGQMLQIKFYAPIDDKKEIEGTLIDYNDLTITIKDNDGNIKELKQADTAKITLKINI